MVQMNCCEAHSMGPFGGESCLLLFHLKLEFFFQNLAKNHFQISFKTLQEQLLDLFDLLSKLSLIFLYFI